jgi:hypothetical protein
MNSAIATQTIQKKLEMALRRYGARRSVRARELWAQGRVVSGSRQLSRGKDDPGASPGGFYVQATRRTGRLSLSISPRPADKPLERVGHFTPSRLLGVIFLALVGSESAGRSPAALTGATVTQRYCRRFCRVFAKFRN